MRDRCSQALTTKHPHFGFLGGRSAKGEREEY